MAMDLCTACALGKVEFLEAEIRKNPSSILKSNVKGWTPIMYACVYSRPEIVSLIAMRYPSSLYSTNNQGQTPLMLAIKAGDLNLVRILMKGDTTLNLRDNGGWTALFYAVYYEQADIIYDLIKRGADVNARDNELKTILMTAIESGQERIIEMLIACGARYDSKLDYTDTHRALHYKHFQLLILLSITSVTDLDSFLDILGLNEYSVFFKEKRICLNEFLKFNEGDLKHIGVEKLGPRRKMALAAQKYNYLKTLSKKLRSKPYY